MRVEVCKGRRGKTLTRAAVARSLGRSRATVERLAASGQLRPVGTREGRGRPLVYPAAEVAALRAATRQPRPETTMDRARARKIAAEAGLRELALARERGEAISVAQHEEELLALSDAVRENMLGVAASAVQGGLVPPTNEQALDVLIRDALRGLAKRLADEK